MSPRAANRRTKMDQELLGATEPWRTNEDATGASRGMLERNPWIRLVAKVLLVILALLVLCLAGLGWMTHDGYPDSPGRVGVSNSEPDSSPRPAVRG